MTQENKVAAMWTGGILAAIVVLALLAWVFGLMEPAVVTAQ